MKLIIKNARVIDSKSKIDDVLDILIEGKKIAKIDKNIKDNDADVFDARNLVASAGFVDLHVHLREPGFEYKETILSGSRAATAGGFTTVCCMPNTNPVIDNQGVVEFIISASKKAGLINVLPIGAITKGSQGVELSEMSDLKDVGVVAVSDDGKPLSNAAIMRRALEYAGMLKLPVIAHSEDTDLSAGGVMHEGYMSTKLGLKGITRVAETSMVSRDIELARYTGSHLHIAHVSCRESVHLIRDAKKNGVNVSAECTPHHFSLTVESLVTYDPNTKVNPPLRDIDDVKAICEGLKDGTIDCIATDHAPHAESEKDVEFDAAPFGMIGLETALALGISNLVEKGILTLTQLMDKMSYNPSKIININKGYIAVGADADITVFDPKQKWEVTEGDFYSKSKNSPFLGNTLKGRVILTICGGKKVFSI
ncbi:MAG: dihydroorotase [Candidatus Omnitrophica bacterium]|nr:dihydroorotase [Candidatus Omnitrophota bacterium]